MTQQYLYAYLDAPQAERDSTIEPDYERVATIGDIDTRERKLEPKADAIVLSFI
ncbi:hypothetical protein J2X04_000146 [Lysobacter niabensis]|uniref:Uncharacterized protein n=1 Tax=Agrilutibacter niabensis TaxID=380628 RepID=A0ABU1VJZ0_9GAMM|nr:hypothetical protein [Lysobacter niabensis]MDR7097799.1 hypothetical protein [Lysobacter niabensis]